MIHLRGEFTWDLAAPATLVDLDLTVDSQSFVAVVGPTGRARPQPGAA